MSAPKRFKSSGYKSLEILPNEIFIEIFNYLNSVDTVYAFSQLNVRFQQLLFRYVTKFNFQSISNLKFNYVIQQNGFHQWNSLCLSNDDLTPGQIQVFCQLVPSFESLFQLQSLSLLHMKAKFGSEVILRVHSLNNLVSLTIGRICGKNIQPFELPSLKELFIIGCKHTEWIMNFRALENLRFTIESDCYHNNVLMLPVTLKQLQLFCTGINQQIDLQNSIRQLSQLRKLVLYDKGHFNSLPNGRIWEDLIKLSFPSLNIFQFCFSFNDDGVTSDEIKQMMASFSTEFYLYEKCWFVRCDSDARSVGSGNVYTLPYSFSEMQIDTASFKNSISTLFGENVDQKYYGTYKKVQTLFFYTQCQIPNQEIFTSNIVRLILQNTISTSWYSLLSNLSHLELRGETHMNGSQFAQLLANTPKLQSLSSTIWTLSNITDGFKNDAVCDKLSRQIQKLTICCFYFDGSTLGTISVRFLSAVVRIFGATCKHLALGLAAHPKTLLPILKRMRQLRSLHIHYRPLCRLSNVDITTLLEQAPVITKASDFIHISEDNDYYVWFSNRL